MAGRCHRPEWLLIYGMMMVACALPTTGLVAYRLPIMVRRVEKMLGININLNISQHWNHASSTAVVVVAVSGVDVTMIPLAESKFRAPSSAGT